MTTFKKVTTNNGGKTDNDANNVYLVTIIVTDAAGLSDTENLVITVTGVNEGPSMAAPEVFVSVPENQTSAADVNASDPDGETENGGGLTYGLFGNVDERLFTIDADTGEIAFIDPPDFENPLDHNVDNEYVLLVQVTDAGGLINVDIMRVNVTNVVENGAPTITSSVPSPSTSA